MESGQHGRAGARRRATIPPPTRFVRTMRTLIHNHDLRTLFGGASVVAAAGLLMGAAMYPDLNAGEIGGPQILAPGGGQRGEVVVSDTGVGVYRGRIPDYVIGTDALKPPAELQVPAYQAPAEPEAADVMAYEASSEIRPTRWQDEPREATHYPSEHGNVAHMSDLPPPPEPPAMDDEGPLAG